jgi:hypothetical protein
MQWSCKITETIFPRIYARTYYAHHVFLTREVASPCAGEAGAYDFDEEERKEDDGNDGVDVAVVQSKTADQAHEPEL